jgi:hypothetical protein
MLNSAYIDENEGLPDRKSESRGNSAECVFTSGTQVSSNSRRATRVTTYKKRVHHTYERRTKKPLEWKFHFLQRRRRDEKAEYIWHKMNVHDVFAQDSPQCNLRCFTSRHYFDAFSSRAQPDLGLGLCLGLGIDQRPARQSDNRSCMFNFNDVVRPYGVT